MVATVGSIAIELIASTAKFIAGFKNSATTVERESARMAKSIASIGRASSILTTGVQGVVGGAVAREIIQYADAWTLAGNKIRAAGESAGVEVRSLEALNIIANRNRSSLDDTVDLYAKLVRSTVGVAKSEQEVAEATEIVTRAFKAGGAAAGEQTAGILQLGQALSSGLLQGDELRSIRENAPLLAKAIADEFGVAVGALKELGSQGQITSDRVFAAILKGRKAIDEQFAQTNATIGDSFTKLKNSVLQMGGAFDKMTGFSKEAILQINNLADAMENAPEDPWTETLRKLLGLSIKEEGRGGIVDVIFNGKTRGIKEINAELLNVQKALGDLLKMGRNAPFLEVQSAIDEIIRLKQEALDTARALVEAGDQIRRAFHAQNFRAAEIASMAAMPPMPPQHALPTVTRYGDAIDPETGEKIEEAIKKETEATYITGRYNRDAIGKLDANTAGYFDGLGSTLDSGFGRLIDATNLLPGKYSLAMVNAMAANRSTFSGLGNADSWAGRQFTIGGGGAGGGDGGNPLGLAGVAGYYSQMNTGDPASISGDGSTSPINVSVTVRPILEGQRLSGQSSAEIKQAASAGANTALRAFYGR